MELKYENPVIDLADLVESLDKYGVSRIGDATDKAIVLDWGVSVTHAMWVLVSDCENAPSTIKGWHKKRLYNQVFADSLAKAIRNTVQD